MSTQMPSAVINKLNETMNYALLDIENVHPKYLMEKLNVQFEIVLEKKGYNRFRKAILDFLYGLLVHQRPTGYPQRWEVTGLAREIARMSSMKYIFLHNGVWERLRTELEHYLNLASDGELRHASEEEFLDELGSELESSKLIFYEACRKRCAVYKQDLVASVMHPARIEKILNEHGYEVLDELFS